MTNTDKGRKWMWMLLGTIAAMQVYFVRELLVIFALFAVVFAAVAVLITGVYMMQKTWEVAVLRVADSQHPVVNLARRGAFAIEEMGRRPFRRPGSATAR
jgi:predicted membrane protein